MRGKYPGVSWVSIRGKVRHGNLWSSFLIFFALVNGCVAMACDLSRVLQRKCMLRLSVEEAKFW